MKLTQNTIDYFKNRNVSKIKIFFYDAGCSGVKINILEDFDLEESLEKVDLDYGFDLYVYSKDADKFKECTITRTVKSDHTWVEKVRYIFSSDKVKDRCGCWSSFNFSKKKPKLNLGNLKDLKNKFNKDENK